MTSGHVPAAMMAEPAYGRYRDLPFFFCDSEGQIGHLSSHHVIDCRAGYQGSMPIQMSQRKVWK